MVWLVALSACAEAVTDEGDDGAVASVRSDAGFVCDRTTDVAQLRKDGPTGLEACRVRCQCAEGLADAKVSIGDLCAGPSPACNYACDSVERGAYVEGAYCYVGTTQASEAPE